MTRLFVFLGSLLVLALAAALVVPPFVNWNQFKDRFEVEATRILGQKVEVLGHTSARLLPLPSVTFEDVRVGEILDGQSLLTAKSFHMDMELAPLLKGEFDVVEMSLQQPRLTVNIGENGSISLLNRSPDASVDISPEDVSLDNIKITNGVLRIRDAVSTHEVIVKDIDVEASARTLAGPWNVAGAVTHRENRIRISGTGGRWQSTGETASRMGVRLTAQPQSLPYDLEFDGPFTLTNGVPRLAGTFSVKRMGRQSSDDRIAFARPSRQEALDASLEGLLKLTAKGAIIPEFKLNVGDREDPYGVGGSAFANFGEEVSFQISAEGQQINLERFEANPDPAIATPKTLKERLTLVREVLEKIPRFDGDGKIRLRLPAVVAGDTVIRDVDIDAKPLSRGAGWRINNLKAQLPGRTELLADGTLLLGEQYGYEGALVLASRQPSGLAGWLRKDVPPVIRELASVGLSATTKIDANQIQLDNLELALDGEQLLGSFRRDTSDGKSQIDIDLAGKVVDYDQLAAMYGLLVGAETSAAPQNVAVNIKSGQLRGFGFVADDVDTQLSIVDGQVDLQKLSIGGLAGAELKIAGKLQGFPKQPQGAVSGTLKSANPAQLLKLIRSRVGQYDVLDRFISDPTLVASTDLAFDLKANNGGKDGTIDLTVGGFSGGSTVKLSALLQPGTEPLSQRKVIASLVLDNANGSTLLAQAGYPAVPINDAGSGRLKVGINGALTKGVDTNLELAVAGLSGTAVGKIKPYFINGTLLADGDLSVLAKVDNFDPIILLSGLPLPGFGEENAGEASFELKLNGRKMAASDISARFGDGAWRGQLELDGDRKPRPRLTGSLGVDQIDLVTIPSLVYTSAPGSAFVLPTENGESSAVAASVPLLRGIDGEVGVQADAVFVPGTQQNITDLSGNLVLRDGDIAIEKFSSNWMGGVFSGDVSLGQTSAARLLSGRIVLQGADVDTLTKTLGYDIALSGKVDLSGSLESAGNNADALTNGLTGSGVVTVRNGVLGGFNDSALATILESASGREADAAQLKLSELKQAGMFDGSFDFGDAGATVTIASGVARMSNVRLGNKRVALTTDMRMNLDSFDVNASAQVAYNPGREALVGASPSINFNFEASPGKISRKTDTASLSTFLGMRAAEQREREFESQKANILERQRLQRTVRLFNLEERRRRQKLEAAEAEQERLRLEREQEIERLQEEAETLRKLRELADEEVRKQQAADEKERQSAAQPKKSEVIVPKTEPVLKGFDDIKSQALETLGDRVRNSLSVSQ